MNGHVRQILELGFLLGWSVAWPPGPINAEVARRCLANGFGAGVGVVLGACSADALWAVTVSLGVGAFLAGPATRLAMGVASVVLLLALAGLFLRAAWRRLQAPVPAAPAPARSESRRFESRRASFLLGATMALSSPWNVAFWLAAIGRPELSGYGTAALLVMAAAVLAGALSWGILWSGSLVLLHRRLAGRAGGRRWGAVAEAATGALMLYFAAGSAWRLWEA